ncbi:hypothetical protein L1987_51900 [Smallanthus sonchifolius]|uniref:Uncharacterized protein n=1 Tax=Smallanthus sonchifolius TaxID=185202 RepID=A0ACB9EQZ3_9ASTR|nr:hypothetical protein L1987_51900 [Smallanthus sonchifolius]
MASCDFQLKSLDMVVYGNGDNCDGWPHNSCKSISIYSWYSLFTPTPLIIHPFQFLLVLSSLFLSFCGLQ